MAEFAIVTVVSTKTTRTVVLTQQQVAAIIREKLGEAKAAVEFECGDEYLKRVLVTWSVTETTELKA